MLNRFIWMVFCGDVSVFVSLVSAFVSFIGYELLKNIDFCSHDNNEYDHEEISAMARDLLIVR